MGKKVRAYSVERIIEDIKFLIKKHSIKIVLLREEQFLFKQERAIQALKAIAELGIEVSLDAGLTVALITDEIAYWLAKAGSKYVFLAVESGSERMLKDVIKKPLKLNQVKPAVEKLRKYGIIITAFFITGFPGETPEDREITEQFIEDAGFNWHMFFAAMPIKGTVLYDICVKNNYIDEKESVFTKKDFFTGIITAPYVEPEYITKYIYQLNLKYNFIKNYDFKTGNYESAYALFKRVSSLYPFHAISHYCLAKTCYKMDKREEGDKYKQMFFDIINTDQKWKGHAEYCGVNLSEDFN
jgi:radical SAM superfamily enzyme YgiQ (UPF0313 family)